MRSRLKRKFPAFGLALVASLVIAAIAASGASALSFSAEKLPATFNFKSGGTLLQPANGETVTCTAMSGSGAITSATSGDLNLEFVGCTVESGGWNWTCTTPGAPAGHIVAKPLKFEPVYLNAAHSKYGVRIRPSVAGPFAEYQDIVSRTITGSVMGEITSPALNVSSWVIDTVFFSNGSTQKYRQIEESGAIYQLSQTIKGHVTEDIGLVSAPRQTFMQKVKLIP
jgi:hypothetical protein